MGDSVVHIACPACLAVNRVPHARLDRHPKCGACHRPLFAGNPTVLDNSNFAKIVSKTDVPVVVDFWAAWCAPCKMMAPHFEQAAARLEPYARLAKLDTEAAPEIAGQFNIRSIPTLIVFKKGRESARQAGAMDFNNLVRFIQSHM